MDAYRAAAAAAAAHSPTASVLKPQPYMDHVSNVVDLARRFASDVASFLPPDEAAPFIRGVELAAEFHDLGKLHPLNQDVLSGRQMKKRLPVNHVDSGVAYLLNHKLFFPAVLVHAHHAGLADILTERYRGGDFLRDLAARKAAGEIPTPCGFTDACVPLVCDTLALRVALSCLVDADHTDTAAFYGAPRDRGGCDLHADLRLKRLTAYIATLSILRGTRSQLRGQVFEESVSAPASSQLPSAPSRKYAILSAPVGSGKTTAGIGYMLALAKVEGLRRIFVVLPMTNIISQSVKTYRNSLVLPNEDPECVVAENHHRVIYSSQAARHLSTNWTAPIVVTTAVQFFETLASNHPSDLRKLHNLAGSGIIIDEVHAALPARLWPQALRWLRELCERMGCRLLFSSGTMSRFWELDEFRVDGMNFSSILGDELELKLWANESKRVSYRSAGRIGICDLVDRIVDVPGPVGIVMNTVVGAARVAEMVQAKGSRHVIHHISGAQCPKDRDKALQRIKSALRSSDASNLIVVGTTCIEAGLDLSFRTAFKERLSLASIRQFGGRVNRESEYDDSVVWDFALRGGVPENPSFAASSFVLSSLVRNYGEGTIATFDLSEAMQRELIIKPVDGATIRDMERQMNFPLVSSMFRVISSDTVTVIVDRNTVDKVLQGIEVDWQEIQRSSVQIWRNKTEKLPLFSVGEKGSDLYIWTGPYDADFGIFAKNSNIKSIETLIV